MLRHLLVTLLISCSFALLACDAGFQSRLFPLGIWEGNTILARLEVSRIQDKLTSTDDILKWEGSLRLISIGSQSTDTLASWDNLFISDKNFTTELKTLSAQVNAELANLKGFKNFPPPVLNTCGGAADCLGLSILNDKSDNFLINNGAGEVINILPSQTVVAAGKYLIGNFNDFAFRINTIRNYKMGKRNFMVVNFAADDDLPLYKGKPVVTRETESLEECFFNEKINHLGISFDYIIEL